MAVITQGMHGDIIYAIKKFDMELAEEIIRTDDDVDRFSLYAVRQLRFMLENENSLASLDSIEKGYCLGYRMVSKSLERFADHANLMGEQLLLLDKPLPKNVVSQLEEFSNYSRNNLDKAVKALLKKDCSYFLFFPIIYRRETLWFYSFTLFGALDFYEIIYSYTSL